MNDATFVLSQLQNPPTTQMPLLIVFVIIRVFLVSVTNVNAMSVFRLLDILLSCCHNPVIIFLVSVNMK